MFTKRDLRTITGLALDIVFWALIVVAGSLFVVAFLPMTVSSRLF